MALTNAEKQARWRSRNQIVLTEHAREIAEKLIEMADQAKLRRIAKFINDHLKHPDRSPFEKAVALGRVGYSGLNGPLSKTAALARARAAEAGESTAQTHSWLVEASTQDGQQWRSGVRLATPEEAEVYITAYAAFELEKAGYVTARAVRCDDPPNCVITRNSKGGRPSLVFPDGSCVLLGWVAVGAPVAAARRKRASSAAEFKQALAADLRARGPDILRLYGVDPSGLSAADIAEGVDVARRITQCESVPGANKRRPQAYADWQAFIRRVKAGSPR